MVPRPKPEKKVSSDAAAAMKESIAVSKTFNLCKFSAKLLRDGVLQYNVDSDPDNIVLI